MSTTKPATSHAREARATKACRRSPAEIIFDPVRAAGGDRVVDDLFDEVTVSSLQRHGVMALRRRAHADEPKPATAVRRRLAERGAPGGTAVQNLHVGGASIRRAFAVADEAIRLERFDGAIRQDWSGAIVFPLRDARGVVGFVAETSVGAELRGDGRLGVWASREFPSDASLIIVSDPVDALAAHQSRPDPGARFLATAGQLGPEKARVVREVLAQMPLRGRA